MEQVTCKETARRQMSESLFTAAVLSLSGGLQDAYTYMARGKVFANAQTGNVILLAEHIYEGNWSRAGHYLLPLVSFALGVAVCEGIRQTCKGRRGLHWRQWVVLLEMILLFGVGFLPESRNALANALVSFACAMQVQAFRKVDGYAFASTMCIGNLRSGTEALCTFLRTGEEKTLGKAGHYFAILFLFALGAVLGGRGIAHLGLQAVWLCCGLLGVVFVGMFA